MGTFRSSAAPRRPTKRLSVHSPPLDIRRATGVARPFRVALACVACALLWGAVGALAAGSAPAATASPLPPGEYETRRVCESPAPGRAACMASVLVGRSAAARAHLHPLGLPATNQPAVPSPAAGDFGLRPSDLHAAYSLPTSAPSAQTIAIVDAYNDPAAEADLRTYDEALSLPACTTENGCFKQVNQKGETSNLPFPKTLGALETARKGSAAEIESAAEATGWGLEISLDIETARAVCQSCHVLLVEADEPVDLDLEAAEHAAETLGATEISNSYGGPEEGTLAHELAGPYNHAGTVITASAGDNGYLDWNSGLGAVEFPAASPHVVAVGGTRLKLGAGSSWSGETIWNGDGAGGGGCSTIFGAPSWQLSLSNWSAVGCSGTRAVADISADADPYTGVAVSDSTSPECETSYTEGKTKHVLHWCTLGGTSLASPIIASVFALAGGSAGVSYPASTLYANALATPSALHDVTSGSNGECDEPFNPSNGISGCTIEQEAAACSSHRICLAGSGYDGPSGLGTPAGLNAFEAQPGTPKEEGAGGSEGGSGPVGGGSPPGSHGPVGGESATPEPGEDEGEDEEEEATAAGSGTISALVLSSATTAGAARHHLAELDFTFTASAPVKVHVTLARKTTGHHRTHWHTLRRSATIAATGGHNSGKLATGSLKPGTYRLTLTTPHGPARSVVLRVH